MSVEKERAVFTKLTEQQYNLIKGLHRASQTISSDYTIDASICGFIKGSLRELASDNLQELGEEISSRATEGGWFILDKNGNGKYQSQK